MVTCQADIKQLAEEVLTVIKEKGWMSDTDILAELSAKGISASPDEVAQITKAIWKAWMILLKLFYLK
jgi:hypothetical protein